MPILHLNAYHATSTTAVEFMLPSTSILMILIVNDLALMVLKPVVVIHGHGLGASSLATVH